MTETVHKLIELCVEGKEPDDQSFLDRTGRE
jgi:hypothetical protein